jgi:pimeloyl-ACP methyl ester carboxylesterase
MTDADLRLDGAFIEHRWEGTPSRSAWVLLHEGLGSVSLWRGFPSELRARVGESVFSYSRLGYGQSDALPLPWPTSYMHDEAARRLPRVLAAAGIEAPVLVGHSDGGSIALIAAATGTVRPRALILVAPHVFVEALSIASITAARDAYASGALRAKLERHHRHVDVAFGGWNGAWLSPDFADWNLTSLLPSITAPTLLVQGEDDPYGTRTQVDAIAAAVRGPCEVVMLRGVGHAPHREAPAALLGHIERFASRWVRAGS